MSDLLKGMTWTHRRRRSLIYLGKMEATVKLGESPDTRVIDGAVHFKLKVFRTF
jgi:hypothetical protein